VRTELESQSVKTATEVGSLDVNPALPEDAFNFKVPDGAEVFGPPAEGNSK
jgi:outer membrane lipoprotein-sorting protein